MAGYSGTPLVKKLGYKAGQSALFIGLPAGLDDIATEPEFSRMIRLPSLDGTIPTGPFDVIHVFEKERQALAKTLPALRRALEPAGMIWVSWPKKSSGIPASLDGNVVRELVLAIDLVDIKVCAVDSTWSGLKMVIPRALRPRPSGQM